MFRHVLVLAAGAAAAAVLADGAVAVAAVSDDARVAQGTALLKRWPASPWKPLAAGSRVPPVSQIKCEDVCSIAPDKDNLLVLKPGAVISVEDWFHVPLNSDGQKLTAAHRVVLYEGSLEAVSSSEHGIPLVVTVGANEHVALRGARVQIARFEGRTRVGVSEGQARAGASHGWVTLQARQATTLVPYNWPKAPEAMVESPHWHSDNVPCAFAPLAMSDQGKESVVGGCWDAVMRGAEYRVELAKDADFQHLIGPAETTRAPSWSRSLGIGHYFVRVRSVDADGLSSQPSSPRKIAVVPLGLPPGSMADAAHGAIVLPEGREITFPQPNGLEVAVDNGGFFKAPGSMRMDGAPSHQLRVRLTDDPSSVSTLHVLRRALRADVRITPATPSWPNDPIDIAVTIADPTGQADTSKVEPQIHVLLGLTEVPISWMHRDAVWSARVEPRRMGGPVVLRVIANDEHGTQLGRNFVEIDENARQGASEKPSNYRVVAGE